MKFFATLSVLFLALSLTAQTTILQGTITDKSGEALIGANVWLQGTFEGATADMDGHFTITSYEQGKQLLVASYLGFDTIRQEVNLQGKLLDFSIILKENSASLREVTISAGNFEASGDKKKAVVLSPLDIALTASASADIAGAIATLPGTTRNGESGQVLVRGGSAAETRTYIDGLLVQNPYTSSVQNLPARNRFSPFIFKGVQFSTGGYSAEYGQAMSSALILHSNDLASETQTGLTLLSVGPGLSHTQRWEKSSLSASVQYTNLAPYFALAPQHIDWEKAPQTLGGEASYRLKTSKTGMLKVYGNVSRSRMKMWYPKDFEPTKTTKLALQGDNTYLNASFTEQLGKDWTFFAGLAATANEDNINSDFNLNTKQNSVQARATLSRYFGKKAKLKTGVEAWEERWTERYQPEGSESFLTDHKEHFQAAFAESELLFTNRLVGRIGLRAEHSDLINKANIAPRTSIAYLLRKGEQFSASWGQFYQTPEHVTMRRSTNLDFERAEHFSLNYQRISKARTFRAEIFQKNYTQLVKTYDLQANPDNTGAGYARGLDLFYRDKKTVKNSDIWFSYSYLDTQRDWRDFPEKATPIFAPKHSFSSVYKKWLPKLNTMVGATYSYNSARPFNNPNEAGFNAGKTPHYHDLSANMSYLTNIAGNQTILHISCTNILGLNQVFGYQYNANPDATGIYNRKAATPPAKRFVVVALLVSFGQKYDKATVDTDDI